MPRGPSCHCSGCNFLARVSADEAGGLQEHDLRTARGTEEGQQQGVPHRAAAQPGVPEGKSHFLFQAGHVPYRCVCQGCPTSPPPEDVGQCLETFLVDVFDAADMEWAGRYGTPKYQAVCGQPCSRELPSLSPRNSSSVFVHVNVKSSFSFLIHDLFLSGSHCTLYKLLTQEPAGGLPFRSNG